MFYENLKKRFADTYKFSEPDINKFTLLLQKGVFSYECMGNCQKRNETSLTKKQDFWNQLNMEGITDANYMQTIRVFKGLNINTLGEYHDFYVQSDLLVLVDAFVKFWNMCH